ncbi:MAG: PA14 domain-containing protein [Bacteroidota bacterium]
MYDPNTYQSTDPTFPVTYSDTQKAQQRTAGTSMMDLLMNAANSGQGSFTIAPGVYRIKGGVYKLSINNFTINCAGVEVWTEYDPTLNSMQWLQLNNCTNIKIIGPITFDSEKLQFIQCTITDWNATNGTLDVQVNPGYDANFTYVYDRLHIFNNGMFHYNLKGENVTRPFLISHTNYDPADNTKKRLTLSTEFSNYFASGESSQLKKGDLLLIRNNINSWELQPVGMNGCRDIEVNGISCYYGPLWVGGWSFGKFSNINCSNYRRPGSNRLGGSEEPGNMDYVNELVYDGCKSGPGQDDGVNALRKMDWAIKQKSPREVYLHIQPAVGEEISFYAGDDWTPQGTAKATNTGILLTDEALRTQLITQFNAYQQVHDYRWRLDANQEIWVVTLDKDMMIRDYSFCDRAGNRMQKITARNCYFADMNVPHLLFRGVQEVLIENNLLERGRESAIYMGPSRYWWEGPLAQNITIRNNQINYPSYNYGRTVGKSSQSAIYVGLDGDFSAKVIRNVSITGNVIRHATVNPICVKNVIGATISNNTFISPEPVNENVAIYGDRVHAGIFIAASSNVTISGNSLQYPTQYTTNLVQVGPYMDYTNATGSDLPPAPTNFLDYTYYENVPEPAGSAMPAFSQLTPKSTGQTSNFNIQMATVLSNFGVVFTGYIKIPTTGAYTFYTNSDDKCELYLDGNKVVTAGPYGQEHSGSVTLTAGFHPLRMEYYQGVGGRYIEASWAGPGIAKQPIPTAVLFRSTTIPPASGLTGNYYNGQNFETPVLTRIDPNVQFNWNLGAPASTINPDNFSVRWTGQIQPEFSETYTFFVNSDNGRRLWVNDQLIIDKWLNDWNIPYSGTIALVAGQKYNIKLEYFEGTGGASCYLDWQSASRARQAVPAARLFPTMTSTPTQTPYAGVINLPGTVEAENYDTGGEGVAYHDTEAANRSSTMRTDGVDIEGCSEGGYNVDWSDNGEWLEYTVNVATAGSYMLSTRVSSPVGGSFHIEMNGVNVTGTLTVPVTGGWQTWINVNKTVTLAAGQQVMRFVIDQKEFNINKFIIAPATNLPLEAESAAVVGAIKTQTYAGYTGSGYVDYGAASGESITWTANVVSAGSYILTFRYASISARPLQLMVNGSVLVASRAFPSTGSWTNWQTVTNTVNLNAGNNTIKLTSIGSSGGNIDHLKIAPASGARLASEETAALSKATLYPNPSDQEVQIAWAASATEAVTITIVSAKGETVSKQSFAAGAPLLLKTAVLKPGVYIVTLQSRKEVVKEKLVISR